MNVEVRSEQFSEETLVNRVSRGDLDAFNQLVLQYQDVVYYHAYALLSDPAAADDAAQESFIKAYQNLHQFHGGSFRAWLLRIATNTAYDQLRQLGRHTMQPLYWEDENGEEIESSAWLADRSTLPQEAVEQKEESERVYRALDGLPADHRTILTLVDLYELDYHEAAQILGVPVGTVKSRLARARQRMKQKLLVPPQNAIPSSHLVPALS